jgi:hypothetical protein
MLGFGRVAQAEFGFDLAPVALIPSSKSVL